MIEGNTGCWLKGDGNDGPNGSLILQGERQGIGQVGRPWAC